jgi:outer membrane protein OmpA-like peptidoglycan-associated protein
MPMLSYRPFDGFNIKLGIDGGYLLTKEYAQKEQLVKPDNSGTFENGKRTRNEFTGEIPEASSVLILGVGGLSYEIPLNANRTVNLCPEVMYEYAFTPVVKGLTWNSHQLRFGASLTFSSFPSKEPPPVLPPPPPPPPPPIAVVPPLLSAEVKAVAYDNQGKEVPLQVVVEEYISTQLRPILNYVFFDDNSSELAERYAKYTNETRNNFHMENMYGYETLSLYHQLLNIVGRRLEENSKSKITLIGCNADIGLEKGNIDLSRSRAETVRNYLRDVWGIEENRMKIQVRNQPDKNSNSSTEDGNAENRRVEIISDSWKIIEPVLTTDTLRVVSPPNIRFIPKVVSEAGLASWELPVSQTGEKLTGFSGGDVIATQYEWNLAKEKPSTLGELRTIEYKLTVSDKASQKASSLVGSFAVTQRTIQRKREEQQADTVFSRYSLILFDFDDAGLNKTNARITDYIKDKLSKEQNITVVGYTDRIGATEYNLQLSESRARSTAKAIGLSNATIKGIGGAELLYDNNLPEGRFYCRTVTISAATPLK